MNLLFKRCAFKAHQNTLGKLNIQIPEALQSASFFMRGKQHERANT